MAFEKSKIGAIVLAGGSSTRMGQPKALLNFGGVTLIERIVRQIQTLTNEIQIITNTPELYAFLNLPMHADFIPESGPLAGIFTGLAILENDPLIVTACDTPFVTADYFLFLLDQWSEELDCLVPKIGKFYEPLEALYSHRVMPVVEDLLKKGDRKVENLFNRVLTKTLGKKDLKKFGDLEHFFWNVNNPSEYQDALKFL